MSKHNPFIPIAEAALSVVLTEGEPVSASVMHRVMTNDVEFLVAMQRAFELEPAINALRSNAVGLVLDKYGEAISTGRDAEHVPMHTPETKARRMAMLEQQRAQLDESLARVRNEYAQMTLEDDLTHAEVTS